MPYKIKMPVQRKARFGVNRLKRPAPNEELTGWVNGNEASDIEERFARGLRSINLPFAFQVLIDTTVSIPGEAKEVDFMVNFGGQWRAVEVDGEIGHKTEAQKNSDVVREALVNEQLQKQGILPIIRVTWHDLENQDQANRTVLELF